MSIKAYVGRMGSGKTYEVVSVVILGALRRGRRVITNIAGVDYAACADLLVAEGVPADKIGRLVTVPHELVTNPLFWLTERGNEAVKQKGLDPESPAILPGDLVALDEIWRFWQGFGTKDGDGNKRPDSVMNFMRMHRHFTHPETGVACDLAIITQDVMDISRQVRAVIEETYRMEKLTAVGSSKRYRVDICQGGQTRRVVRQIQRSYEDKYFSLYKSHSGRKDGEAGPREENIDGRGNLLQGALFKIVLPVGAVVACLAIYTVWNFLHPEAKKTATVAASSATQEKSIAAIPTQPQSTSQASETKTWRVVGWIAGTTMKVILSNGDSSRILEPVTWKLSGTHMQTITPEGEVVTPWTGRGHVGIIDQAAGRR